ncbi:hypothetical protein [Bremerella sp. P1]|uniref:hypothetical protein n=1 Tax=Bremerella sp. P1 TaxID=3026424 RepID=UPI0023688D97|nr:hypothetical protein [Bremerella sp. P1]WDI43011.1 hypothetical protein PSR63_03505 [Bremerella sp. P1]
MTPEEREAFQRRFQQRQQIFLSAVEGLATDQSTWQIYLDDQRIVDGQLIVQATQNGPPSPDLDKLKQYCQHITGQGFQLEIVVDTENNFHVMSWEVHEPDWPEELEPVLFLRWNTVGGE